VLACSGIEGQMTGGGEFNPEILQLPDQCLGFCELAQDLEPPLVQESLQTADQCELLTKSAFLAAPICGRHRGPPRVINRSPKR
jgi:hypothetical protein